MSYTHTHTHVHAHTTSTHTNMPYTHHTHTCCDSCFACSTNQATPSVSHDITILRLMPEMHSTASHTLFEAALQDGPAVITDDPSHVLPLGSSPSQPPTDYYRRTLYPSSEDKSDTDDVDPEPLPSPYPTAQQVGIARRHHITSHHTAHHITSHHTAQHITSHHTAHHITSHHITSHCTSHHITSHCTYKWRREGSQC